MDFGGNINPLNQTLDEYINGQKSKRSLVDGASSSIRSNDRSFKKRKFSYPTKSYNNYNYRPWKFPRRNSMPHCRRAVRCCDPSHCIIHNSNQWNGCGSDHFFDDLHTNWGLDNNCSYEYRTVNRHSNLRKAKSCESVASKSSYRSNQKFNNKLTKQNLYRHNTNNENVDEDPRRCPLNETMQKHIWEIQNSTSKTSPLSRPNTDVLNCKPKHFDTGIKLTIRIGGYYKPIEEKIIFTI